MSEFLIGLDRTVQHCAVWLIASFQSNLKLIIVKPFRKFKILCQVYFFF